ncbi:MAG: peptidyl-prolyl cis-trans isomerase [Bacillota bacterium]|nr:peptidyl-prolyl cis-trans isomerase [Bacillota bacterium]
MENIIILNGNVKYPITLDPGVWIFDDRRIDLTTYFNQVKIKTDELEEYTKDISRHWDREIIEGAIFPPTLKTEKKFEKEKVLTGSFGIPFKPFLLNAEPNSNTEFIIIKSTDGDVEIPIEIAYDLILGFSDNGKPLTSNGPAHCYFGDGSNQEKPIKNIYAIEVK